MKPQLLSLLCSLSAVASLAAAAAKPASKAGGFDPLSLTPAYHQVSRLDESSLSPFRKPEVRAAQAAAIERKTGPDVKGVIAKFHEMGLTGVIPSAGNHRGLIVLGGQVFSEGQMLCVYDPMAHKTMPLFPDYQVTLSSVTPQFIELKVSRLGETASPANVPIGLLEFLQR